MPINSFSVGRDVNLQIVTAAGVLNVNKITGFNSKQDIVEERVKGLDGITRHIRFPDGWSGTFEVERQDSTVDDYFAQLESNYYLGIPEFPASITETITENGGGITQYRYFDVLFKLDDAGHWRGQATVKQSMSFVASRRVKIL